MLTESDALGHFCNEGRLEETKAAAKAALGLDSKSEPVRQVSIRTERSRKYNQHVKFKGAWRRVR